MASPEVLDFAKLLAPIPGDKPTGADLRSDPSPVSVYYKIKGARSSARAAERQMVHGEDDPNASAPDWRPVLDLGLKALAESSKDLEVTAYLIEALVRTKAFPGLRDGFRLGRELVERYWDDLYPTPDEDGLETRVAAITGLNGDQAEGTLIVPIAMIPITDDTSLGRLNLSHYQEAQSVARIKDAKERDKRVAAGAMSMEKLQKAVAETPGKFYVDLVQDLTQCSAEFAKLSEALSARCGDATPPSSNIRAALETSLDLIKDLARAKLPKMMPVVESAEPSGTAAAAAGGDGAAVSGNGQVSVEAIIRNRDEALSQLLKVAEYFRRTEPHSVISYALEQAVAWGRMSLPELLSELIPEEGPRKNLFKFIGIKPPEPAKAPEPAKK